MFGASSFSGFGQQNQQASNAASAPGTGGMFGQASTTPSFGAFGQPSGTGTSAFGQSQPTTSFGQPTSTPQQPTPFTFGQTNTGSTFGAPKPATGFGAFGASSTPQPAQPTLGFGQQPTAFGAQPSVGFGAQQNTGFFGQQNTGAPQPAAPTAFGGFGAAPLGAASVTQGTATTPYAPYREDATPNEPKAHAKNWDVHQSIASMPAYASMSPEELRLQDYRQGRSKGTGAPGAAMPSTTPAFGASTGTQPSAFGAANPTQPTSTFGQPSGGLFGQQPQAPSTGGLFGQPSGASSTPAFGAQPTQSSGLFGQSKPAGTMFGSSTSSMPLFGQSAQQQQPGATPFGQSTSQPSTGFSFGQSTGAATQPASGSTGFSFGANNASTGAKPAFGGFGSGAQQPQSTPFSFGASSTTGTGTQPGTTPFGGTQNTTSTFSFGANNTNNAPKPGGLFGSAPSTATGAASSTPSFGGFGAGAQNNTQTNKPAFSFGSFGTQNNSVSAPSSAPGGAFGQNTNTSTTGGTTGGLFGAKPATGAPSFGFGSASSQPSGGAFGQSTTASSGSSLFGAKPAQPSAPSTGLFGQSSTTQPSQPSTSLFGQNNQQGTSGAPSTGGLFGGGAASGAGANSTQAKPSLFSFGSNNNTASNPSQPSTSLFGQAPASNTNTGTSTFGQTSGGGLFGQSQPASTGGGLFGASTFGAAKPLGASAPAPSTAPTLGGGAPVAATASPASLTTNPFGTDGLLGTASPSAASQPPLPFNVAPKSKAPLVSPFRSSPRNAVRVTRLRGTTPGLDLSPRERTPLREGTPGLGASRSMTPARSSSMLFRGPSDTQTLSPQAFIPRSTSKRLVLDGDASFARSPSVRRDTLRLSTPRARFSPAVERAADVGNTSTLSAAPALDDDRADLSVSREVQRPAKGTRAPSPARAPSPTPALPGDYVLSPPLAELRAMDYERLAAVKPFTVSRVGFGAVAFLEPVDLATLPDLSYIGGGVVQLRAKECFVYPQEEDLESDTPLDGLKSGYVPVPKAPLGQGLNVPARVSLEGCWPLDRATREPLKDPAHARVKQHIAKLKNKKETEFVSYEPESGTWTFIVQHFSRYGLDDSESDEPLEDAELDEEDEEDEVPAMHLGDEPESDSSSSSNAMRESELGDAPEVWVPAVQRTRGTTPALRRSTTPAIGARLDAPASDALPRKVQVMRASFFGNAPPPQGPAVGAPRGPTYDVARDAADDVHIDEAAALDADATADEALEAAEVSVAATPSIPVVRAPLDDSVMHRGMFASDAGLTLGRAFRAGCGPRAALATPRARAVARHVGDVAVRHVQVPPDAAVLAEALLAQQLAASDIAVVDGVPMATPKPGTSFSTHAQHYAADDKRYAPQLFHLGAALFDPVRCDVPADAPRALVAEVERLQRKTAFSEWLARAVAPTVQSEARAHRAASRRAELVFALLSGHQVEHAADAAVEANDLRLATLVAQAGGDASSQAFLADQLRVWEKEEVLPSIGAPMRRVYECLAGHVGTAAKVATGLDWRRALGLHVWYGVPWEAPLAASVDSYAAALAAPASDTQPPLPAYVDAARLGALKVRELAERPDMEYDAMFELLKLHVDPAYPLERVLNARNFGACAVEHTLPWHTYVLLTHALQLRAFADVNTGEQLTLAYAAQLEAQGLWHWAAFVLLHLTHVDVRRAAVQALLERNVALLDSQRAFLDKLAIPEAWRAAAEAVAARAAGDYYREYMRWLDAGDLSAAHHVAVTYLAPETFVRADAAVLLDLFRPFGDAEQAARTAGQPFRVAHWNTQGRVLLDYATLPHILPPLLAKAASQSLASGERHALQQATQRIHELIEAVPLLYPPTKPTVMTTVARSEMLVVLHNLARLAAANTDAPEPSMHWTPAHPPEVEQLQAAAADFGTAMLASL
ncbi:hypothetical protein MBRA1_000821 [Malassezia brasiliensis]|uniref:Peptidase S59 domain-containing protein n=1 Tax=Malassezia brasiliensis TaxID=1821822 RepID=A0AAF0IRR6_9BASI|nr:hypothetical protein MBRA1_000821 [Malassezia brasiliensis]